MSFPIDRRRLLLSGAAVVGAAPSRAFAQGADDFFEVAQSETATIDGRKWNMPIPGGMTVDAVHRSVLLRFPTAAALIADQLRQGRVLAKAELVLTYSAYEIVPEDYTSREGMGRKAWTENPPTWHVRAWPLRQPWMADATNGPTFTPPSTGAASGPATAPAIPPATATMRSAIPRSCRAMPARHISTSPACWRRRRSSATPAHGCAGSSNAASCCASSRPTTRATAIRATPTSGRCRSAAMACASPTRDWC